MSGPERFLLLDRSPDGPRWLLVTVAAPGDARAADLAADGTYTGWRAVTAWARERLGRSRVALAPVPGALAWMVDETGAVLGGAR